METQIQMIDRGSFDLNYIPDRKDIKSFSSADLVLSRKGRAMADQMAGGATVATNSPPTPATAGAGRPAPARPINVEMNSAISYIVEGLPHASTSCRPYLRKVDGSVNRRPSAEVAYLLFCDYLRYLNEHKFRYRLMTGSSFWTPSGFARPTGNCQSVAFNFLHVLWAFGFEEGDLGLQIVKSDDVENEKIITKHPRNQDASHLSSGDAGLLGASRGTRTFKVNRGTNALEPLQPGRNPFEFHAISYVRTGGRYRYYDARTGYRYQDGVADLFEGYRKGPSLTFSPGGVASDGVGIGRKVGNLQAIPSFVDPGNPLRRVYLLPSTFDAHPVVVASVKDYDVGGNWVVVDEDDWAGERPGPETLAPAHVTRMFESFRAS